MYRKRVGCVHIHRISRQHTAHNIACHLRTDIIHCNTAGDAAAERPGRDPYGNQAGLQRSGIGSPYRKG